MMYGVVFQSTLNSLRPAPTKGLLNHVPRVLSYPPYQAREGG